MGVGEQDEVLVAQVVHLDVRLRRERVVGGGSEDEGLDLDGALRQAVSRQRRPEDADVEAAVAEAGDLGRCEEVGVDFERDVREVVLERSGDAGQLGE